MNSPFDPLFGNIPDFPPAFRTEFLAGLAEEEHPVLQGHMNVWYRWRWLFPVFWIAEKLGVLISEQGENIPTTLTIETRADSKGRPVQYWNRVFHFRKDRYFNTVIKYMPEIDDVVEYIGPGKLIGSSWNADFQPPGLLTFHAELAPLPIAGRAVGLPGWLRPWLGGVFHFKQTADETDHTRIHIEMIMHHPLMGDVFGYNGVFTVAMKEK